MGIAPRSTFVTVVAWIFIFLAGFATLVSILQNVMVNFMFPGGEIDAAFEQAGSSGRLPGFVSFMLRNMRLVFLFFLLASVATLASSIGLLLRQDWARIAFVLLMVLGVLWNLAGVVLSFSFAAWLPAPPPGTPADFAAHWSFVSRAMIAFNVLVTLGFAVLFAWIAKKLLSPGVRAEFT
jgi:hypothetical protein